MKKKVSSFIIAFFLSSFLCAYAVPAKPGLITMKQPDGTEIKVRLLGDETGHLVFNESGLLMKETDKGFIIASPSEADSLKNIFEKRHQLKRKQLATRRLDDEHIGLLSGSNFPTLGEHRSLVLLVEFPNARFSVQNPKDYYHKLMNDDNISSTGAAASARQYLINNSRGKFQPYFDVVGPIMLPKNFEYYGENVIKFNPEIGNYLDDAHPYEMLTHACEILSSQDFDFTPYDCNNDGEIDNVYLFYAGYGEADGGLPASVWPHSGNLLELLSEEPPIMYNELILNHYACNNELKADTRKPGGFGTFIHEFSHVMGFPDLYPLNGGTSTSPDDWDVMDLGCYLNGGFTPPNYNAFELYAFRWLTPEEISSPDNYELPILHSDSGLAYIVYCQEREDYPNEFFIFENRQKKGQDAFIPGHGMLVWHIDYHQDIWDSNSINNNEFHSYMRIVEADGIKGHYVVVEKPGSLPSLVYKPENEGDTFPGTTNNTSFTSTSKPAFVDWDKNSPGFDIINITESEDGLIRFNVIKSGETGIIRIEDTVSPLNIQGNNVWVNDGVYPLYDLLGRKVASLSSTPITLPAGIYISPSIGKFSIKDSH